jgi:hypothetical protein
MQVFVFNSRVDPDLLGFSQDATGRNLPLEYSPWEPATEGGAVLLGDDADHISDANVVLNAVRRDGFFLAVGGYEDEGPSRSTSH